MFPCVGAETPCYGLQAHKGPCSRWDGVALTEDSCCSRRHRTDGGKAQRLMDTIQALAAARG